MLNPPTQNFGMRFIGKAPANRSMLVVRGILALSDHSVEHEGFVDPRFWRLILPNLHHIRPSI